MELSNYSSVLSNFSLYNQIIPRKGVHLKIIKIYGFPEKQKSSGSKKFDLNPLLPEPVDFQGFFNRKNIKVRNHLYQRLRTFVVEVRGIEPLSEKATARLSPSAVCVLDFPRPDARRQA